MRVLRLALASNTVVTPRRRTLLLSLLGGLGLLLTLVGIFSMTAYAVARRTQEISIRMAFGAGPADVVLTMVPDAAWPALLGLGRDGRCVLRHANHRELSLRNNAARSRDVRRRRRPHGRCDPCRGLGARTRGGAGGSGDRPPRRVVARST